MTDAIVTAAAIEAANTGDPDAEVSLAAVEAVNPGAPGAEVSGAAVEAVNIGDPDAVVSGAWVDVFSIGAPSEKVSVVGVEVWRTIRDAPYPVFPVRLFNPPMLGVRLSGGAVFSPGAVAGNIAVEDMPTRARWTFDFGEVPLLTREQVLTWRMFAAATDMGVRPCLVSLWDRLHQPTNGPFTGTATIGSLVWDDTLNVAPDEVDATFAAATVAGSTTISFNYAGPNPVDAGEHFSVLGRRYNWRLYRIIRVLSDAAGVVTAEIRPGLREWAKAGERLNFDYPCCVARVDGDVDMTLELLRLGKGAMRLVECDSRYP